MASCSRRERKDASSNGGGNKRFSYSIVERKNKEGRDVSNGFVPNPLFYRREKEEKKGSRFRSGRGKKRETFDAVIREEEGKGENEGGGREFCLWR